MAAPDFYFAINATFRFIHDTWGEDALVRYWETMGHEYFAPLSARFREGGMDAVEAYWRDFYSEEPGGDVEVTREGDRVRIEVRDCPALKHLRANGREVMPLYCRHCHHVSTAIAKDAGLAFRLDGGGGTCRQAWGVTSDQ